MELARQLPVRLLDLVVGRVLRDAEHLVRVAAPSWPRQLTRRRSPARGGGRCRRAGSRAARPGRSTRLDTLGGLRHAAPRARAGRTAPRRRSPRRPPRRAGPRARLRQADALDHLRLLVVLGCLERALEVVEHGQEPRRRPARRRATRSCSARARHACGSCRSRPPPAGGRGGTRRAPARRRARGEQIVLGCRRAALRVTWKTPSLGRLVQVRRAKLADPSCALVLTSSSPSRPRR